LVVDFAPIARDLQHVVLHLHELQIGYFVGDELDVEVSLVNREYPDMPMATGCPKETLARSHCISLNEGVHTRDNLLDELDPQHPDHGYGLHSKTTHFIY
jgi:hypothetical protein